MSTNMKKIKVAVLGATGMVGQRMLQRLSVHPFFEIAYLGASSRSAGKRYKDATQWRLEGRCPKNIQDIPVKDCSEIKSAISDSSSDLFSDIPIVFSALDSKVAGDIEDAVVRLAKKQDWMVYVISNASNFRNHPDVPLLIPEVNPHHLAVVQGKKQAIITNPNCCAIPFSLALAPLHEKYGIKSVCVSTYQAVSGAGYPGESAWDMVGNIHPHSGNEEEKLQAEPLKILGSLQSQDETRTRPNAFIPHTMKISARCVRVATADGHLLGLQVQLQSPPLLEDKNIESKNSENNSTSNNIDLNAIKETFSEWEGHQDFVPTPSTPSPILEIHDNRDRPSPRFDSNLGDSLDFPHLSSGMAVSIGRIEHCPIMGIKLFALAHNTIRGAAGAAIANAELLVVKGFIPS